MPESDGQVIQAAGGVLWRPAASGPGVEVALVHRPKYDDWSVPKGKLQRGEHVLLGAVREVEEETGFCAVPGRPLRGIDYLKDGVPKHVHYWAMRQGRGRFVANAEVDQMMWLPPREAQVHLAPERDRVVLEDFAADLRTTRPFVVVRHASAGDRDTWPGDDHDRPLDETGRAQAEQIADLLDAYQIERALSADVLRCLETLGPFSTRRRLTVHSEPLLSESGYAEQPDAAVDRLLEILDHPAATVVCTQKALLPDVVVAVVRRLGGRHHGLSGLRKGDLLVLHLSTDPPVNVVGIEHLSTLRSKAA